MNLKEQYTKMVMQHKDIIWQTIITIPLAVAFIFFYAKQIKDLKSQIQILKQFEE